MSCKTPKNYTLVIAEKSKAARKIAEALSNNYSYCKKFYVNFWIVNYSSKYYIISPAAGHLFNLYGNSSFPVYETEWKPLWQIDPSARYTKKYYDLIKSLSKDAQEFINACDYDIEGSLIGYLIINFLGDIKRAKRAKFSALTKEDILNSFRNLKPLDYDMIHAGIARHKVDWLWGINVSRALMKSVYTLTRKRVILSAGRVQSPTLIHVINNTVKRELFVPLPYYSINLTINLKNKEFKITIPKTFENKNEAKQYLEEIKKVGEVTVTNIELKDAVIYRPPPFNLTDLQLEAGRLFGYSPYLVERLAENLYLNGLISYPRTNSQKIPPSVNIYQIIDSLSKSKRYGSLINTLSQITKGKYIVRQGEKDDPAHPAIYPTGELPYNLDTKELKLYELILRRFLASMSTDARVRKQEITLRIPKVDIELKLNIQSLIYKGWIILYPYTKFSDEELLDVKKGDKGRIVRANSTMKVTKPDTQRVSKIQLLKWMESNNLGTEATRGRIIETLFKRKYLMSKGKYAYPTPIGIVVTDVLSSYFKDLTDVRLTSEMEKKLNGIISGKFSENEVVEETKKLIEKYINEFENSKNDIGTKIGKILGLLEYKKCKYCELEVYKDDLCKYHLNAIKLLKDNLKIWKERTDLTEESIIKKLKKLNTAGKFIRDVLNTYYN
ncbi:DNA topoisomerase I [Sulfolobus acidocaldarius]|uniref:DNA topoisomerase n=4 Tax=Sulfolobus acidocaldarius TaxID=2285 RepID=Q4J922_SULAC|nr:DNA topoisomerase I [Sulfolobus acidocaldarius]AAY80705.1 DNA topoisomerase I family A [Sulfolobus acidocaldarius DSM 639]AGE71302.1 DNA topoisomerase I [Sulfolobus acidocaldarius N8]AGE73571.1 DNA topoisomerase I [Sulfolobus acidocaldarius Ron12/I]ALU30441.1 DNA topoisomerase III [Sulfolobus acidocaldarius]ALU31162.1 DNA topoisomerase III [Sulfolobus acidocaldarius]